MKSSCEEIAETLREYAEWADANICDFNEMKGGPHEIIV
nr:MAG TPA: hypothetical protein [Caudoviricetes sp.]